MANLLSFMFQNSILLCGLGGIGFLVDLFFFCWAYIGLFVLSVVATVVLIFRRYRGKRNSAPLSILSIVNEESEAA